MFQIAERSWTIAALGDRDTTLFTHREIDAAMRLVPDCVELRWVASDSEETGRLDSFDGLWVLPGTPYRDDDAVFAAIRFAREQGMPMLGTCGGFQYMAVEFARNVAGIAGAAHAESEPDAEGIVVGALACSLVGRSERLPRCPARDSPNFAGPRRSRDSIGAPTGSPTALTRSLPAPGWW